MKKIYQMWAKYQTHFNREDSISDLYVYPSEKIMWEHENVFRKRLKNNYLAKEILEIGFNILFLEEEYLYNS